MEPKTKEEMDYVLANNELIGRFMKINPEEEYYVGNDDGSIFNPKYCGYNWPPEQKSYSQKWLKEHNNGLIHGQQYYLKMQEWWPWYNQDWNKLMDAWNFIRAKIHKEYDYFPPTFKHSISLWENACFKGEIKTAYKVIIDAINWYNSIQQ